MMELMVVVDVGPWMQAVVALEGLEYFFLQKK
jgi:hypothetical protein